jgi:hypothetical protein
MKEEEEEGEGDAKGTRAPDPALPASREEWASWWAKAFPPDSWGVNARTAPMDEVTRFGRGCVCDAVSE